MKLPPREGRLLTKDDAEHASSSDEMAPMHDSFRHESAVEAAMA